MSEDREPAISVVVPLYNKAAHIARCLESVRAQTCQNLEIIVVDDGSTDGSPELVKDYLAKRDQLIFQSNAGPGPARNTGIAAARGKYIAFLDADDQWAPEFVEVMSGLLARHPTVGMAICRFIRVWMDGKRAPHPGKIVPDGQEELVVDNLFPVWVRHKGLPQTGAIVIPREVFSEIGVFCDSPGDEDTDLFGRVALEFPTVILDQYLLYYHEVEGAITTVKPKFLYPSFVTTVKKRMEEGTIPTHLRAGVEALCAQLLVEAAIPLLLDDRINDLREMLAEAKSFGARGRMYRTLLIRAYMPLAMYKGMRFLKALLRGSPKS